MGYPKLVYRNNGLGPVLASSEFEEKVILSLDRKLVGVRYYDGWTDNPNHPFGPPWDKAWFFKDQWPGRRPQQGFYQSNVQAAIDRQQQQGADGGIDYWSICWYYDGVNNKVLSDNALKGMMASTVAGPKFIIGFESESQPMPIPPAPPVPAGSPPPPADTVPYGLQKWYDICDKWGEYFKHPNYQRTQAGDPIVEIIKVANFHNVCCVNAGKSHAEMLQIAKDRTGENIYFIGCTDPVSYWISVLKGAKYNAFSMYNMFTRWTDRGRAIRGPSPTTFRELADNIIAECRWCAENIPKEGMDVWLIGMSGWDSRPWAGNLIGIATPEEFEYLLQGLYDIGINNPAVKAWVLYAWNEWGEGGFIEPSNALAGKILSIVRKVLKKVRGV